MSLIENKALAKLFDLKGFACGVFFIIYSIRKRILFISGVIYINETTS